MLIPFPVERVFYQSDKWLVNQNGVLLVETTDDDFEDVDYEVPDELLDAHHPLLSKAVRASLQYLKKNSPPTSEARLSGDTLRHTFQYLVDGAVEFHDIHGRRRFLLHINKIAISRDEPKHLLLNAVEAYVVKREFEGVLVSFVEDVNSGEYPVYESEMNNRYPGWQQRLDVAHSLDLDDSKLVTYVFASDGAHSLPLPNLDIDLDIGKL